VFLCIADSLYYIINFLTETFAETKFVEPAQPTNPENNIVSSQADSSSSPVAESDIKEGDVPTPATAGSDPVVSSNIALKEEPMEASESTAGESQMMGGVDLSLFAPQQRELFIRMFRVQNPVISSSATTNAVIPPPSGGVFTMPFASLPPILEACASNFEANRDCENTKQDFETPVENKGSPNRVGYYINTDTIASPSSEVFAPHLITIVRMPPLPSYIDPHDERWKQDPRVQKHKDDPPFVPDTIVPEMCTLPALLPPIQSASAPLMATNQSISPPMVAVTPSIVTNPFASNPIVQRPSDPRLKRCTLPTQPDQLLVNSSANAAVTQLQGDMGPPMQGGVVYSNPFNMTSTPRPGTCGNGLLRLPQQQHLPQQGILEIKETYILKIFS